MADLAVGYGGILGRGRQVLHRLLHGLLLLLHLFVLAVDDPLLQLVLIFAPALLIVEPEGAGIVLDLAELAVDIAESGAAQHHYHKPDDQGDLQGLLHRLARRL